MTKSPHARELSRTLQRQAVAARRVGVGARCEECGESRPEALITGSNPKICFECQRRKQGRSVMDAHHVAAEANSPVTIPVPVNDHRAELSERQNDWPKETLENRDGSPLLAGAGRNRGFIDTERYLAETQLLQNAEMLETLNAFLVEKFGPKWWIGTPLEKYAPKQ